MTTRSFEFPKRYHNLIIYLALIFIPLLVFWQTTSYGFVWDDGLHLTNNIHLINLSYKNMLHLWTKPFGGLYIPVSYTVWAFLKPVGMFFSTDSGVPFNSFIYHLANLILHIINGLLVFGLLRLFIGNKWAVFGGTLLFLVHPIQVEAVAWVSEFRGLLSTGFGLSALHLYLIANRNEKVSRNNFVYYYVISSGLFFLAILSKPSAAVIPIFAWILDLFFFKHSLKQIVFRILPWIFIIFPVFYITSSIQSQYVRIISPFWIRPFIWMDAINFYFYKLIYPVSLAASYARTPNSVMDQWWIYIEWVIPVVIVYGLWRLRWKLPILGISFTIFVIGFLPVSGLISFAFQEWSTTADRFMYMPMVGVSMAFAYQLSTFRYKSSWFIFGIFILVLGIRTHTFQVPVWKNSFVLWSHCIKISPNDEKVYINRGNIFKDRREYEKAIKDYNKALEINPKESIAFYNRGLVFQDKNEYEKAIEDYSSSIRINPRYVNAYFYRGTIFLIQKEYDKAINDFSRTIEIDSLHSDAYYNRGIAFREQEEYENALTDLSKTINLDPQHVNALNNRGVIFGLRKEYAQAIQDFNKALEINPDFAEAYNNRGHAFQKTDEYDQAMIDYNKALEIDPQYVDAYYNRGTVFSLLNEYLSAIEDFDKAIELDPEYTSVYHLRAVTFYFLENYDKAWADVRQVQKLGGDINAVFLKKLKSVDNDK